MFSIVPPETRDESNKAKSPAKRIFPATVLDACEFVIEFLGQFARLPIRYLEVFSFVADQTDRRNYRCGAGSKHLFQRVVFAPLGDLFNRNRTFGNVEAPMSGKLQHRVPGDTWQDRSPEGWGYKFVIYEKEDITGANLLHILEFFGIKPQDLGIAFPNGFLRNIKGSSIVPGSFRFPHTPLGGTHVGIGNVNPGRAEPLRIIGANRPKDDVK